ncbi:MAG: IclR family transcriptional regulator [Methylophilus sp.]|nr:IclR family transcriptional regulator [Methylophilus sp.]
MMQLPPGSLNRASILLTAIAQGSRKGSLLTELVSRTGLPRPTIHRTINLLMEIGWVERNEQTARFNLGAELAALGYSAISRNPIERVAMSILSELALKLNQVVYLTVRSGMDMVCIGRYECQSEIQVGKGRVGLRGPFGMTQNCVAMLACLDKREVDEIVKANISRFHRIQGFDERGFLVALTNAREFGYGSYDNILLDRTVSGLGVAICDSIGYPLAGIGATYISGWLTNEQKHECLEALKVAATKISERLRS